MYQQQPRPPGSIKVLGILNLVFAGLGVIGLLFTYAMYFGGLRLGGRNPVVEIAHSSATYMTFLKVTLGLGVPALIAFATSGIGLIGMKPWGRKLAIGYAIYAIAGAITGLIVTYVYVLAPLSGQPGSGAGMFGGLWGGILGCAYPIILLIFMMRRNVVGAFARIASLPEARVIQRPPS